MATAAHRVHGLTKDERELLARLIDSGEFRDQADFEEFAIRRALAELRLRELQELRKENAPPKVSMAKILRETRKVRREMWREREAASPD